LTTGGSAFTAATQTHTYDSLGQLATTADNTTTSTFSTTSAGEVTATTTGSALGYNAAQELTSLSPPAGATTTYSYDDNGSRTTATTAANGSTPARTSHFAYTAAGNLASVTLPDNSVVSYTSNGDGLRESRTRGTTTDDFTWDNAGSLSLLLDDGTHAYVYGPSSTPIEQINDATGATDYLFGDALGSSRLLTDGAGAATGTNTYDDYGQLTLHTGTSQTDMGYTGNWTDPTTQLVYLRARDYDPTTTQFLTVDPAVDQTRQPYAYAANDPLLSTDPQGLWSPGNLASSIGSAFSSEASTVASLPGEWLSGAQTFVKDPNAAL
jgi:RHS repeat-associated protein